MTSVRANSLRKIDYTNAKSLLSFNRGFRFGRCQSSHCSEIYL